MGPHGIEKRISRQIHKKPENIYLFEPIGKTIGIPAISQ